MIDYARIEQADRKLQAMNGGKKTVDVNDLSRRWRALREERTGKGWDAAWQDLSAHFLPTKYRDAADSDAGREPQLLNKKIVDTTGILAMRTLAAGMQGGMTSPVRPWFKLTLEDEEAAKQHEAGEWLDEVTRRMLTLLHNSNFYNTIHGLYSDLGTFGTALLIETADWKGLHFQLVNAGTFVLDTDENDDVDVFFRSIFMDARQIIRQFGESHVPDIIIRAAKDKGGQGIQHRFEVIHGVFPRNDVTYGKLGGGNMPFASVYWLTFSDGNGKPHLLRESGFEEFPAFAPRWDVSGTDVYGRSPAMDVLPDCRMLQAMRATVLKMLHKNADPPVNVPAELKSVGVDLTPGGQNYIQSANGGINGVTPIQQIAPQSIQYTMQAIEEVRQDVGEGLYSDLFKMLIQNDRRQITATEIEAREQEKLILVGPVVERLHKELLSPVITRTYELMRRFDHLPPVPESLAGVPLRVEFMSVLAQAQRMVSTSGIDQTVAFVANTAQIDPSVLDNIDFDKAVQHYVDDLGAPASIVRSEEDVRSLREQRAQAQAQAQQQAQAQAAVQSVSDLSGAAKNLGQTPVGADGQTAMDAIIGGLGGM